jgi:hypothetical protein
VCARDQGIDVVGLEFVLEVLVVGVELGGDFGVGELGGEDFLFALALGFEGGFVLESEEVLATLTDVFAEHWLLMLVYSLLNIVIIYSFNHN